MGTMEFKAQASTSATPEDVWAILSNPATWDQWWEQWRGGRGELPLQQGSTVQVGKIDLDPEVGTHEISEIDWLPMTVEELEENRRLTILNQSLAEERFIFTITPSDGGSEIEYRREAKVGRLLGLLGRAMKGRLESEAETTATKLAETVQSPSSA